MTIASLSIHPSSHRSVSNTAKPQKRPTTKAKTRLEIRRGAYEKSITALKAASGRVYYEGSYTRPGSQKK